MRYIKPDFYGKFSCTADKCPDTCCAGWQIMIDEDSLEKYGEVKGVFGNRLNNSIDWLEGAFYQYDGRCAFLNERNLCDLYTELGCDSLCDTCRKYPRHTEEYEGLRELSLSLSCPVAAEIILSQQGFPQFILEEDDEDDELEDEFEDFDLLLFTQLEDARNTIFEVLKNGKGTLQEKMNGALVLAARMQKCLEEGCFSEIEELIEAYRKTMGEQTNYVQKCSAQRSDEQKSDVQKYSAQKSNEQKSDVQKYSAQKSNKQTCNVQQSYGEEFYERKVSLYHKMYKLERLRDEWTYVLEEVYETLYADGFKPYARIRKEFDIWLEKNLLEGGDWENAGLQLFVFFLYTYFCGAVYDDWVYSKMALSVHSVEFIRELLLARWVKNGNITHADYEEISYRYAREIEHSDQNLNELEEIFMDEYGNCIGD